MKKITVLILSSLFTSIALCFAFNSSAFACTGVYVGSEASEDGTSMIARSCDTNPRKNPSVIKVYGGHDGEKISQLKSSNGFVYDLPNDIYRFIAVPSCEVVDLDRYFTSATNNMGVSISATVTAYVCPEAAEADPRVKDGLCEDVLPAIVAATCSSARDGIKLIASIIDQKGSSENNVLMISDQKECWYMEIYAGHQYCAVKAPDDCVCGMGNEYMLDIIDKDSDDTICSTNLFNLPAEKGYAKYDTNGNMILSTTYAGENKCIDFSHMRTWRIHQILSPNTIGDYETQGKYPLFFKPENKVSLADVMEIFRDRYNGTKFCPETNNKNNIRTIADESQTRTHILQTYKNVAKERACVEWLSMCSAEFSTFVPLVSCETKFDNHYTTNICDYRDTENNAFLIYKNLSTIVDQNRNLLGEGVHKYWQLLENYSKNIMSSLIYNGTDKNINEYCVAMQGQSIYDAQRLAKECQSHMMQNDVSFKRDVLAYNPYSEEDLQLDTFYPSLDVELFAKINNSNIVCNKIQCHPGCYDYNRPGDDKQADKGGKEGYISFRNGNRSFEIHTGNGHVCSMGSLSIDGSETEIDSYLYDGKTYASIDLLNNMNCENQKRINPADISAKRPHNNFWSIINKLLSKYLSILNY